MPSCITLTGVYLKPTQTSQMGLFASNQKVFSRYFCRKRRHRFVCTPLKHCDESLKAETFLGHYQIFIMNLFSKNSLTIFAKGSILDVGLGPEYASEKIMDQNVFSVEIFCGNFGGTD